MLRNYILAFSLGSLSVALILLAGCGDTDVDDAYSGSVATPVAEQAYDMEPNARPEHPPESRLGQGPGQRGDQFDLIEESRFLAVRDNPLSTFSIDVDTASYAKTRQYLMETNTLPPPDAVRIEELVNYFDYDYAQPTGSGPFAVHVQTAVCPWRNEHSLVRIGLQGKELDSQQVPKNLVFLIDVSGSMNAQNKLPLLKQGLMMLVDRLGQRDRVAAVVYAGAAGLAIPSTPANQKHSILSALNTLKAGGSTNGGEGVELAYQVALDNFIEGGVNRVVLCTDGDFNVGVTGTGELVRLAERHAQSGVYLSVLGFGIGNLNDAMLEQISNKANGNYAFIDTQAEAYKVLIEELGGTLVTIAKDVKIQVEFNPAHVAAYRLIGYENRRLADREFNDDRKDAGEVGAGHNVTALYELVLSGQETDAIPPAVDDLKYQTQATEQEIASDEWLTVKLRYKLPDQQESTPLAIPVVGSQADFEQTPDDYRFASAVALFGMVLRDSAFCNDADLQLVYQIAAESRGDDRHGYRIEFLDLVRRAAALRGETLTASDSAVSAIEPLAALCAVTRTAKDLVKASPRWETCQEHGKATSVPQYAGTPPIRQVANRWPYDEDRSPGRYKGA